MNYEHNIQEIMKSLNNKQRCDLIEYLISNDPEVPYLILEWYKETLKLSEDSLQKESSEQLDNALLMEYWGYAGYIISEFNEYGGGPEEKEETAYYWLDKLSELIEEGNISHEAKISFMDSAFIEYNKYNSGFEDSLTEIFFELCQTEEEWRYLIAKLNKNPSDWNKNLIIEILRYHLNDNDAYLEFRSKNLEYGIDYYQLACFYVEHNNIKKAVETAEEGLLKGKGRLTELFEFLFDHFAEIGDIVNVERIVHIAVERREDEKEMLNKLFDYYRSQGNYGKAKDALLRSFAYDGGNKYKEYRKIKSYLKIEDWNKIEPSIFESLRDRNVIAYLHVCMDKGMKNQVMDMLINRLENPQLRFRSDELDDFADQLKDEFPKRVIEYYWQKAYCNIPGGNRKTYRIANTYLDKAKEIYIDILKERSMWDERLNALKFEFKNRPAFLEEISNL
ncbi:lipopolysaccharide assembly protein LapB [Methanohalophilus sp. WG1-DM]|uniref:tetratricopeptide repeat protein n=1 Tax=Methanohalophilus sp. WG1-DM TaxID=2491675 RepID=UPI000FABED14|nr:hypothetical protein [Methanohalophilus sp. WG1-DM]RSD34449.1 MAG: hypothetical protein CI953_853 [Methanohalophilus sp.]RXG34476.1 hypothetical protein CI957_914 [Methanohalophilus sp. WG1-DM]